MEYFPKKYSKRHLMRSINMDCLKDQPLKKER